MLRRRDGADQLAWLWVAFTTEAQRDEPLTANIMLDDPGDPKAVPESLCTVEGLALGRFADMA
jgi:hypothetical protein